MRWYGQLTTAHIAQWRFHLLGKTRHRAMLRRKHIRDAQVTPRSDPCLEKGRDFVLSPFDTDNFKNYMQIYLTPCHASPSHCSISSRHHIYSVPPFRLQGV
jgi:hypothetical protein